MIRHCRAVGKRKAENKIERILNLYGVLAVVVAITFASYELVAWNEMTASVWGTWAGAFSALAAAVVALYLASERQRATERDAKARDCELLLALHNLVKEIRQMTTLFFFQLDDPSNPILYPNFVEELRNIQAMMDRLPLDRMAAHGQIPLILTSRRIASELAIMLTPQPLPGDGFYIENRNKLSDIESRASKISIHLSDYIKNFDSQFFKKHEKALIRL